MRIYVTLLVAITMLSISFAETIEKDENTSSRPWPMYCHDAQHTGRSEYDTSMNEGKIKWKVKTGVIKDSPVIANDGTIYVGGESNKGNGAIYAINPNGTVKWAREIFSETKYGVPWIEASPAIGEDGTIYVGTWEGYLYAFTPDGKEKWKN
ncbi:MAG: PQQ-like beta-propeller repeat protein [Thermoplasmata archaeon]|nr:PQQ-like beta-propeller repeat protein [Thermoplasmata archaeon]